MAEIDILKLICRLYEFEISKERMRLILMDIADQNEGKLMNSELDELIPTLVDCGMNEKWVRERYPYPENNLFL